MAAVTINIPNIGNVVAENAASEETLQKILAAMQKQNSGGAGGKKAGDSKEEKELKKAREDETKQIKKSKEESEKAGKELKKTSDETSKFGNYVKGIGNNAVQGLGMMGNAMIGFGKTVAATGISLATAFATSYEQMAKDPIGAASTMLATNIDLAGAGIKAGVDVVNGGLHAVAGVLGPFSGVVTGASDAMAAAAKAAVDFATTVLKVANQVFANEFKKSAQMLHDFTKSGASFAGGMTEMRNTAHNAGIMMDTFSNIVKASGNDIRAMGLNQADGANALAHGMSALKNTVGKSGNAVREELLALGYSYEEQGQIVATMGASMKAAGQDIRNLAPADLAKQTKEYATNMKVLSDITGKDAKKAMEEANQKSMMANVMAQLSPEEAKKFQQAYASMPDYAKKGFLEYVSTGGTAIADASTNIAMSQNAEFEKLIKGSYDSIKDNSKSAQQVQDGVLEQTAKAGQAQAEYNKTQGAAIGIATQLTGAYQGTSDIINGLTADSVKNLDATARSREAAEKQSVAQDAVTKGYQDITKQMNDFGMEMEKFATDNLPSYAKILADNAAETMKTMKTALDILHEGIDNFVKRKADEAKDDPMARAAMGMGAGALTGAAIGSVVPVIGTAVGAAVGGLVGGAAGWFSANTAQHGEGGLAKPGKVNVFGETGPEAAIPLPDGKTIPATIDFKNMKGMISQDSVDLMAGKFADITSKLSITQIDTTKMQQQAFADVVAQLSEKIEKLGSSLEKQATGGGGIMQEVASHLEELKDTALKQLDAHDMMKRTLNDSKDHLRGILSHIR
jgi:hypothetical protein